jgi:uncharacterized protein (AIM24 family)
MQSNLFQEAAPVASQQPWSVQGGKMLKVSLQGDMLARQGAMVAYTGNVQFHREGAGLDRYLAQWATGEGVPLMRCSGQGDVYFAYLAKDVELIYLNNDGITLNGSNVLAMQNTLQWDIAMVQGAAGIGHMGLFNVVIHGTGFVAMTSTGTPLVMQVYPGSSTYADPDAAIAWSTSLHVSVQSAVSMQSFMGMGGGMGMGGMLGGLRGAMSAHRTGETWQMRFEGQQGYVVVQPAEIASPSITGMGAGAGHGGPLGGLGGMMGGGHGGPMGGLGGMMGGGHGGQGGLGGFFR